MTAPLMGPAFEPWERFLLLSLAAEEVAPERAPDVLPLVMAAANVCLRQIMGKETKAHAYAAVERARARIEAARLGRAA